jgi:hypothetical protein
MRNQLFNQVLKHANFFCAIDCTEQTRVSPNTTIPPAHPTSILLKTHGPQIEHPSTNEVVGGSTPLRPATFAAVRTKPKTAYSFAKA